MRRTIDTCLRGGVLDDRLIGYEGVYTLPSHHSHHQLFSRMPPFSLRKRFRRSRPARKTSDNQPSASMYYLGATTIPFADYFCPGGTTVISDPACYVSMHDDIAMSTIQTALAVLQEGSSLAAKLPFIAPIAGLLLQALTMRDVRVRHISSVSPVF